MPPPPAPIVASRPVASPAAFALVPSDEGALLVWAAPFAAGGGVRAIPLGPAGEAAGREHVIASRGAAAGGATEERVAQVVELDAAATGRRVGVAWIVDHGVALEAQSAFSLDGGRSFSAPNDLGPTVRTVRGQRGRLAMAASDEGSLVLYHRIPEAPCVASEGTCARFTRTGVGTDAARATRGTEPLEVQRPCEPFVASALWRDGTWYYTVCHAERAPRAMVYAIRPALEYAAPLDSAPGCAPVGIGPLDDGVAVITRCGGTLTAVHLDEMGRVRARLAPVERSVSCEGGRPTLRLARGERHAELSLAGARGQLEALLPETIAPPGSRAIWTGEALLVAAHVDRDVSLRRYQCVRGGRLDRTDVR